MGTFISKYLKKRGAITQVEINGTVTERSTFSPFKTRAGANITVTLRTATNIFVVSSVTDSNGDYLLTNINPGSYVLTADNGFDNDFADNSRNLTITSGNDVTQDFTLDINQIF